LNHLYASPFRVYLSLIVLALAGIYAGLNLPISLFPNSSRPTIGVQMPYGSYTIHEFVQQHGNRIEAQLRPISTDTAEVEQVKAHYDQDGVHYDVKFTWGSSIKGALKEVETIIHSYTSQLPEEIRNQTWVYPANDNSGFFAVSFYSSARSLDEVYRLLEPVLVPKVIKLRDAANPELFNPTAKEVRVELDKDRMAAMQLLPKDIDHVMRMALSSHNGGFVTVGVQQLPVQIPRLFSSLEDLHKILVPTPAGKLVHISDIASVDYDLKTTQNMSFKTSGTPSLILFTRPRPGGNVKKMSEDILKIIHSSLPSLPKDIEYKVLVDPSEFIRASIQNVFHEVMIGAFLAVLVLFLFIGSFKNTVTAAIEIPLSMVMAFIPMKLSGMSINLISLGGLALSAGMNVDASVVVMENIFRHFEKVKAPLDFQSKLKLVIQAVNEIKFSVIASTIASLVVFLPLAFTSNLTYAILGDLAKAVVFSHGFSAFVALILVPTVRLHLVSRKMEKPHHSPIEKQISGIEDFYVSSLGQFIQSKKIQAFVYGGSIAILVGMAVLVLPRLPKEVIGKPDTDWIDISVTTQGNTLLKQMEETASQIEDQLLEKWSGDLQYTFTQVVQPNRAWIMARLKHKSDMNRLWKGLETQFTNTPFITFHVSPWNPAELPIPDPPHLRMVVRGGTLKERAQVARDLYQLFESKQIFPRLWTNPDTRRTENIVLRPYLNLWSNLRGEGVSLTPGDLADYVRVMSAGRKVGDIMIDGVMRDVVLRYSSDIKLDAEEIAGLPLNISGKMIPLKALNRVELEEANPSIYQEDQREVFVVLGKQNEADPSYLIPERLKASENLLQQWKDSQPKDAHPNTTIEFEDAREELTHALDELVGALGLSIALIFLILMIQFGDVINALLVMVAVPLGLIGVLISLFVFRSTLSLNSVLGVILLNGIAVANSIILVDFLKLRVSQGLSPYEAALDAAKKRLRPILITSLTTILGMLPVALGFGEGGRILQPLGIAVSGGLWVSMGLTLFIVPALQVRYLNFKASRLKNLSSSETGALV
jgi:multidrug efflux pump subunit AcrB